MELYGLCCAQSCPALMYVTGLPFTTCTPLLCTRSTQITVRFSGGNRGQSTFSSFFHVCLHHKLSALIPACPAVHGGSSAAAGTQLPFIPLDGMEGEWSALQTAL